MDKSVLHIFQTRFLGISLILDVPGTVSWFFFFRDYRDLNILPKMTTLSIDEASRSKNRLSVIKFMELCLSVACSVLHYYSFDDGELITAFVATGTFTGFIVVLIAIFASYLIGSPINKRLNIFYSIIGCALFITSGVFIIEAWEKSFRTKTRDLAMAKGSVAIINGVMFFLDTVFTYRDD